MKSKINFKVLLAVVVILGAMFLFGTTKVQAYSMDGSDTSFIFKEILQGTPTANSLDNILTTMTLDMKKTNPEELTTMIYNQVAEELKKQGILLAHEFGDYEPGKYYVSIYLETGEDNLPIEKGKPIEKVRIGIYESNEYGSDIIIEKEIIINWTNKSVYNEQDKKYVERQLSKLPKSEYTGIDGDGLPHYYYMPEQEHEFGTKDLDILPAFKKITGLDFVYYLGSEGGGAEPFYQGYEFMLGVFKDGICYSLIYVLPFAPTKITVPSNIEDTDTAYMNYALPKIQKYINEFYDDYYHGIVSLQKLGDYWYKVYSNGKNGKIDCGNIIIKKEEGAYIGNNIYANNLPLGASITIKPTENSEMKAEISKLEYTKILGEYEIILTVVDKLVNPIDITFKIGTQYNGKKACVLHKKMDGTYEKFEQRIADGKITITVDELSPFVIAVNETDDYLLGDVDGNGEINAGDAVMILKHVAHNIELTEEQLLLADTTKDGNVDAGDAVQILKFVAHNITEF